MAKLISFAEIVQGRDASVRITEDNLIYAVDLVCVVTGETILLKRVGLVLV
jgi:hypothetical protein